MPLASEVTTRQEPDAVSASGVRLRSRIRTNEKPERIKQRLEKLGLLDLAESIEPYEPDLHWMGTGHGYEILWRDTTTFADLSALARL